MAQGGINILFKYMKILRPGGIDIAGKYVSLIKKRQWGHPAGPTSPAGAAAPRFPEAHG
jgi:hypothetical protein